MELVTSFRLRAEADELEEGLEEEGWDVDEENEVEDDELETETATEFDEDEEWEVEE